MTSLGMRQWPAMLYYYAGWNRVKLRVTWKQISWTELDEQMLRDMSVPLLIQKILKKDKKIPKYSTAHISIKEHVFTPEPTKLRVSLIVMSVPIASNKIPNCFHMQSTTAEISQNVFQKTNEGGWDFFGSHPKISDPLCLQ